MTVCKKAKEPNLVPVQNSHTAVASNLTVENRKLFANDLLEMIDHSNIDVNCIWFLDEAHFHLDGFFNNLGEFEELKILKCVFHNRLILQK